MEDERFHVGGSDFSEKLQYFVRCISYVKHCVCNYTIQLTLKSKKISNDQDLIQSDPTSCPQNQKGNN